jgi:hypothetical protein
MDTLDTKNSRKIPGNSRKFFCTCCGYGSDHRHDFSKHLLSKRHVKMDTLDTKMDTKIPKNSQIFPAGKYVCECGKAYKYSQGLSKHKSKCFFHEEENSDFEKNDKNDKNDEIINTTNTIFSGDLVIELLKQNSEFKELLKDQNQQMIDLIGNGKIGNTNTNSNNVTNKNRFNLNFFLNEQCKDAMNIMDFVNTIQLQLSDLERVGELGYVKGISHIVVNKLKDMDIHKRPIHCSDLKRETMYVKDQDIWEKENENKEKLSKMITHVAHKNQKQIGTWQKENPEYKDSESTTCDKYLKIVGESMSGLTHDDESEGYTNKIIKNIAKEVTIKEE